MPQVVAYLPDLCEEFHAGTPFFSAEAGFEAEFMEVRYDSV